MREPTWRESSDSSFAGRRAPAFLALLLLLLSLALLNGFPLYYPDSWSYTGDPRHHDTARSPIPGLIASALYPLVGSWALPLINSAAVAFMIVRVAQAFRTGLPVPALAGLAVMAGLPIFTSLIMPDAWICVLIMAVLLLLLRWSAIDLVVAAIAVAGHGSHFVSLLLLLPFAVVFWPTRAHAVKVFAAIGALGMSVLVAGNLFVSRTAFPDTFGWSIVAAKMLNDVPSSLDDLCTSEPAHPLCANRALVRGTRGPADDNYYIWVSPLGRALARRELNDAGRKLFAFALLRHPLELASATLEDWARAYRPDLDLGISGYLTKSPDNRFIHFLIDQDRGRFVREGWLESRTFHAVVYAFSSALLVGALLASLLNARRLGAEARAALILLWSAVVASDFIFALLSTMSGRYHLRAFGLLVPIALIACNATRAGQEPGARPGSAA